MPATVVPVLQSVLAEYDLRWDGIHGVIHWARVLENGLRLAEKTGANVEVVKLFSVLHDSKAPGLDLLNERSVRAGTDV